MQSLLRRPPLHHGIRRQGLRSGGQRQTAWPESQGHEVRRRSDDPLRRPMQRLRRHGLQTRPAQTGRPGHQGQDYVALGSQRQDGPQEAPARPRVHRRAQGGGHPRQSLLRGQGAEAGDGRSAARGRSDVKRKSIL